MNRRDFITNGVRAGACALAVLLLGGISSALDAQATSSSRPDSIAQQMRATDSLSGRWESRSRNPAFGGNLYLRLVLEQRGDSVRGTALMEYKDQSSESPNDLTGTIRDGKIKLAGRFGTFELTGVLRNGKLETRIVPGRAVEASAFSATFVRAP